MFQVRLGLEISHWPEPVALLLLDNTCCPCSTRHVVWVGDTILPGSCLSPISRPLHLFPFFKSFCLFGRAPSKFPFLKFVYFSSDSQSRATSQPWVGHLVTLPASSLGPSLNRCTSRPPRLDSSRASPWFCSCCFLHLECSAALCPLLSHLPKYISGSAQNLLASGSCPSSPSANSLLSSPVHFIFLMRHMTFGLCFYFIRALLFVFTLVHAPLPGRSHCLSWAWYCPRLWGMHTCPYKTCPLGRNWEVRELGAGQ